MDYTSRSVEEELESDYFDVICRPNENPQVQSPESLEALAREQRDCAKDLTGALEGSQNDQMVNHDKPTLAGVHSHMTKHIQGHQDFYREWSGLPDFDQADCKDGQLRGLKINMISDRLF